MKKFNLLAATALVAVTLPLGAAAADMKDVVNAHETTKSMPAGKASKTTKDFINKATVAGLFEIQSSKLALSKSDNADVKEFAEQMVTDHSKASDEMKTALTEQGLDSAAPTDLDDKHAKIMDKLEAANGPEFDKAYIKAQTDAHKEAVNLFGRYAKRGDNAELKSFAGKTLPTLKEHKDHVVKLKAS